MGHLQYLSKNYNFMSRLLLTPDAADHCKRQRACKSKNPLNCREMSARDTVGWELTALSLPLSWILGVLCFEREVGGWTVTSRKERGEKRRVKGDGRKEAGTEKESKEKKRERE